MKCRCQNCGAVASLDLLVSNEEARDALIAITMMSDELTRAAIKYIGMFRPANKDLKWSRVAKLLNEIMPMITSETVTRGGVTKKATRDMWLDGIKECIAARDMGRLSLPLKTHGYLLEIVSNMQYKEGATKDGRVGSKMMQAVSELLNEANESERRVVEADCETSVRSNAAIALEREACS